MNNEDIPMMFRAQIDPRCQIHRVQQNRPRQDANKWVDNWKQVFPKDTLPAEEVPKPIQPPPVQKNRNSVTARPSNSNNLAFARSLKPSVSSAKVELNIPQFGNGIEIKEYTIRWRLVTNSGQDEGVIRPIIGAKGFPHYSGASMKGSFLRACKQMSLSTEETENYCGAKLDDGSYKPGILRFHGAYPVDMNWTKNLVDIIHRQDEKQVIKDEKPNANAQISLHHVKLKFGISSTEKFENPDSVWKRIWEIWEFALSKGLGSRVSAGYGQFQNIDSHSQLIQIHLQGQGATSKLVDGTKEFRPNMFKAALRGHTLRLLGGLTDVTTAKEETYKIWGGFNNDDKDKKTFVGLLGIGFDYQLSHIRLEKEKQFYQISQGKLNILCMHDNLPEQEMYNLRELSTKLVQFTILFSGFGKSWRRICHKKFYSTYFENPRKQVIGSHWEFINESQLLYLPVNQLSDIAAFINDVQNTIKKRIPNHKQSNQGIPSWRESWYSPKVEVWGRFAENGKSKAIHWFHGNYDGTDSIKNPHPLSGSMGNTGRIWHRMYPRYIINSNNQIVRGEGYVELLTIFKEESSDETFLNFLADKKDKDNSGFEKIW
jgi:CRISPR-associated protein Cmr6